VQANTPGRETLFRSEERPQSSIARLSAGREACSPLQTALRMGRGLPQAQPLLLTPADKIPPVPDLPTDRPRVPPTYYRFIVIDVGG